MPIGYAPALVAGIAAAALYFLAPPVTRYLTIDTSRPISVATMAKYDDL